MSTEVGDDSGYRDCGWLIFYSAILFLTGGTSQNSKSADRIRVNLMKSKRAERIITKILTLMAVTFVGIFLMAGAHKALAESTIDVMARFCR